MSEHQDEAEKAVRSRGRWYRLGLAFFGLGLVACATGFLLAEGRSGDIATGLGVLAGAGFAISIVGGALMYLHRPAKPGTPPEPAQTRHDRLQAERSGQLVIFPLVGLMFLVLAMGSLRDIMTGDGGFSDWLSVTLPVLYAWVTAVITLGWDGQSSSNRRFLEDELTAVLRARAMTAAFLVLMAGATVALVLALIWPQVGVLALLAAIATGGATAGMRFAWLDREAGRGE